MKKLNNVEKKIAALPPNPKKVRKWTLEEDAAILKYAEDKGFEAIARVLGILGPVVRRRYMFLQNRLKG